MRSYCPKCNQKFADVGGFCPFDGNELLEGRPSNVRAISPVALLHTGAVAAVDPLNAEYEALIGATLDDRYLIEKQLGEGGMGIVFLAKHIVIEKRVAIKVLKRDVARDQNIVKRFVQEARAASKIGHPNIIDVTDFGTTPDGLTYQVMEYLDGRPLSSVLMYESPLLMSRALPIIAQLARALSAAHEKGIVHRDLKPDNIFVLDRDGRRDFVKIVDFGIAKVIPAEGDRDGPRLTRAGTVFGTPEYMAPEQAAGRIDIDQRADIYALGTILYEMLTGRVPFKSDSTVRTLAMQMLDPIQLPRQMCPGLEISDEFEDVVMKALAKKKEDRYPTMKAMLAGLERVAGDIRLEQPLSASSMHVATAGPEAQTLLEGPPTTVDTSPPGQQADQPAGKGKARRKRPSTHDPAFVNRTRAPAFEVDEELPVIKDDSTRWFVFVLVLLVFAGGGVAVALFAASTDEQAEKDDEALVVVATDAAPLPPDARIVVLAPTTFDAALEIVSVGNDKRPRHGHKRPNSNNTVVVPPPVLTGEMEITVITRPSGASLYINGNYSGPDGTRIRRDMGTKLTVTCKLVGYRPGAVRLRFNGTSEIALCKPTRPKKCVKDIKNPFDDCPD